MKKSVIAILLSIMMISGSIGAVPVFAAQPPAVQEAADILTEEYGSSRRMDYPPGRPRFLRMNLM